MSKNKQLYFPKRLRQLRLAANLTQVTLSKELNLSRSCLANYEGGKRFPDASILSLIADYFKVNVDYMLGYDNCFASDDNIDGHAEELLKKVSKNGKLDISKISPLSKVALFEFYHFLTENEKKVKKL